MKRATKPVLLATVVIGLFMQGCALTAEFSDPHEQSAALDRWNQCLARFDANVEHFCDGHRRDVLATYPVPMSNHVDLMLEQQTHEKRLSRAVKTGLGHTASQGDNHTPEVLFGPQSEAISGDL